MNWPKPVTVRSCISTCVREAKPIRCRCSKRSPTVPGARPTLPATTVTVRRTGLSYRRGMRSTWTKWNNMIAMCLHWPIRIRYIPESDRFQTRTSANRCAGYFNWWRDMKTFPHPKDEWGNKNYRKYIDRFESIYTRKWPFNLKTLRGRFVIVFI